jgi:hypothetical protein
MRLTASQSGALPSESVVVVVVMLLLDLLWWIRG